jgi:hypothetical protein
MTKAILALSDGTVFEGTSFGADAEAVGETVFNTSMTGYQEILTDPSYCGQLVVMTYPEIGNVGVNPRTSNRRGHSSKDSSSKSIGRRRAIGARASHLATTCARTAFPASRASTRVRWCACCARRATSTPSSRPRISIATAWCGARAKRRAWKGRISSAG